MRFIPSKYITIDMKIVNNLITVTFVYISGSSVGASPNLFQIYCATSVATSKMSKFPPHFCHHPEMLTLQEYNFSSDFTHITWAATQDISCKMEQILFSTSLLLLGSFIHNC